MTCKLIQGTSKQCQVCRHDYKYSSLFITNGIGEFGTGKRNNMGNSRKKILGGLAYIDFKNYFEITI